MGVITKHCSSVSGSFITLAISLQIPTELCRQQLPKIIVNNISQMHQIRPNKAPSQLKKEFKLCPHAFTNTKVRVKVAILYVNGSKSKIQYFAIYNMLYI